LKDIYSDVELSSSLGFKGGTALMFFHGLPRFSVDLDFNLINIANENNVYSKVRNIIMKYGKIHDEALKFYGPVIVLDYGTGERKLKIEISKRSFEDSYEIKNLLGVNVLVMVQPDMFAHKLCALLDRSSVINRDIFDCWFFMQRHTPVNRNIIEQRMGMPYEKYIEECIQSLESIQNKNILNGLGELMEPDIKKFVRTKLLSETIILLNFYKSFPI
jgi:predicted nucleotidyltransferase component of viral defense system